MASSAHPAAGAGLRRDAVGLVHIDLDPERAADDPRVAT